MPLPESDRCKPIAGGFTDLAQVIDFIRVIFLYNFVKNGENCCMKHEIERDAAAYRAATITSIKSLKFDAMRLGFDWPTDPNYDTAPLSELSAFQSEVLEYIMDNWDNYTGPYPTEDQE